MEVFSLVLQQMLMMFLLVAMGAILTKKKIVPADTDTAISKLETWVFIPALTLSTQLNKCTAETFTGSGSVMIYGLILISAAVILSYPLSLLFVPRSESGAESDYRRNIYKYSLAFSNFGYMGNFIMQGIWGDEGLFKYQLFCFFLNVICYSWGLFILIPKDASKKDFLSGLKKGLLTPPMIALVVGIVGGLLNVKRFIPDFFMNALTSASSCMGPAAMLLAGIVIGSYNLKELLLNKRVYIVSLFRLILIPALFVGILKLIGADSQIILFALMAFATPLGLNTIVYPAAYGGETKTGASMTMISTFFSVITIPLMYLLFIVL